VILNFSGDICLFTHTFVPFP